jgi:hypothetical protein
VPPSPEPKSEHDFLRLVQYSGAGCLGLTAALLASLKSVNPTVRFEFSGWTVLAFAGVAGGAWYVAERVFFRARAEGRPPPVKRAAGFTLLLTVATLAGFALATRGASTERQHDMAVGTVWAVLALSIVGVAFWKVVQFLERDAARTDAEADRPADQDERPP